MRVLKLACLLLYALALAVQAGLWTDAVAFAVRDVALVILATHSLEALVAFRYVRRYQGPLPISLGLTLLFGLLHLMPLARQSSRT